jgi:deoxyribonuclease-4
VRLTRRRIGAHAPAAGGLARKALPYIDATGAGAVQVFVSNPRGWARTDGDPTQDEVFAAGCAERGVPVYIHAPLLVNLGSPTPATVEQSAAALAHGLRRGREIGATAVVFHAGSAVTDAHLTKALRRVRRVLTPLLEESAAVGGPRLLVEPSAGGGRCLAARVEDLERYLDAVNGHPWLGVCFDTCHAWAAGHDVASPDGMAATLDALVATIGPDRLGLVHANDSRDACGSLRDRHETVGAGSLGEAAFRELLRHPATAGVPVVVETPSTGHTGHATDIATLTRLARSRARPPAPTPVPDHRPPRRPPRHEQRA